MKNYCCFITYAEREYAEEAFSALANKLMIKGQKYKLMWGRPQNQNKIQNEDEEELNKIEKKNFQYETQCPIYNSKNYTPKVIVNEKSVNIPISANLFDPNVKPYYPSMDPNSQGGLLKKNSDKISK